MQNNYALSFNAEKGVCSIFIFCLYVIYFGLGVFLFPDSAIYAHVHLQLIGIHFTKTDTVKRKLTACQDCVYRTEMCLGYDTKVIICQYNPNQIYINPNNENMTINFVVMHLGTLRVFSFKK